MTTPSGPAQAVELLREWVAIAEADSHGPRFDAVMDATRNLLAGQMTTEVQAVEVLRELVEAVGRLMVFNEVRCDTPAARRSENAQAAQATRESLARARALLASTPSHPAPGSEGDVT